MYNFARFVLSVTDRFLALFKRMLAKNVYFFLVRSFEHPTVWSEQDAEATEAKKVCYVIKKLFSINFSRRPFTRPPLPPAFRVQRIPWPPRKTWGEQQSIANFRDL